VCEREAEREPEREAEREIEHSSEGNVYMFPPIKLLARPFLRACVRTMFPLKCRYCTFIHRTTLISQVRHERSEMIQKI